MRSAPKISQDIIELAFEGFDTKRDPVLIKALETSQTFCADMASKDKPARWITLLGPSGVGKTHLLRCITRFFRDHLDYLIDERSEHNERYIRKGGMKVWANAVSEMQSGDFSGLSNLKNDWFVALDDIGTERSTSDFAVTKLYEVLNARENLFTAISANLYLEDIAEKMDTRIASRLIRNNSLLVDVKTIDYYSRSQPIA